MCIRDRLDYLVEESESYDDSELTLEKAKQICVEYMTQSFTCLLYTSDAADERSSVDLGGRRIIKKKKRTRGRGTNDDVRTMDNNYTDVASR